MAAEGRMGEARDAMPPASRRPRPRRYPTGRCSGCGGFFPLRQDGRMKTHQVWAVTLRSPHRLESDQRLSGINQAAGHRLDASSVLTSPTTAAWSA